MPHPLRPRRRADGFALGSGPSARMAGRGRRHPLAHAAPRPRPASVGLVVALVAIAFVARTLLRDREEIADALEQAPRPAGWWPPSCWRRWAWSPSRCRGAAPCACSAVTCRSDSSWLATSSGEIGKYVPGGVWPILGRGELARRHGVRRGGRLRVGRPVPRGALPGGHVRGGRRPARRSSPGTTARDRSRCVLLLPVGLVALHPRVLAAALRFVERVTRRHVDLELPSWRQSVTLVSLYVPAWLAIGAATWVVARALDPDADLWQVGAAAVLSWIVGFVLVPVPGGVGVREAAFVAAAGSLDPGIAAATAVAARAAFVIVDAVGAGARVRWRSAAVARTLSRRGRTTPSRCGCPGCPATPCRRSPSSARTTRCRRCRCRRSRRRPARSCW